MNTVDAIRFLSGIGMAVPLPDQRQAMLVKSKVIPVSVSEIVDVPYPSNESEAVRQELAYLASLRPSRDEARFAKVVDGDLAAPFRSYLADQRLPIDISVVGLLVSEAVPLTLALKFKYNRSRPRELAYMYGVDLDVFDSKSANTPSYPSGHMLQATLIAEVIGALHPQHLDGLREIAEKIGLSRMQLGLHFQSDIDYGRMCAQLIAPLVKINP